jgi:hypothetical protein
MRHPRARIGGGCDNVPPRQGESGIVEPRSARSEGSLTLKLPFFWCMVVGLGGVLGRMGGATFERGFAADLLQVQRGEISDSSFDCDRGAPDA